MSFVLQHSDCLYHGRCKLPVEECNEHCLRYVRMRDVIELSDLPKKYCCIQHLTPTCRADVQSFDTLESIRQDIYNFVKSGGQLYICSSITGNGKSSWASFLLLSYFQQLWMNSYECSKCRGKFVNCSLLCHQRKNLSSYSKKYVEQYYQLEQDLFECDVVVWDEFDFRISDYDRQFLYTIINARIENGLCNIYTSNDVIDNYDISKVDNMALARLVSRVRTLSKVVEIYGNDQRSAGEQR